MGRSFSCLNKTVRLSDPIRYATNAGRAEAVGTCNVAQEQIADVQVRFTLVANVLEGVNPVY